MNIGIFSLTYRCRGHSKEYIDNFMLHLSKDYNFKLFYYEQKLNESGVGVLDYKSEQYLSVYRKIIRRFFCSLLLCFTKYKEIKKCDKLFFSDYEYISLLIILWVFKSKDKVVWIHSTSLDGGAFYYWYKKLFFYTVKYLGVTSYVVNGDYTHRCLADIVSSPVHTIQYPSELSIKPLEKNEAKAFLGFGEKKVFSLLGMIRADKNYEFAIKAFSKSDANNNSSCLLYIAGAPSGIKARQVDFWLDKYGVDNVVVDYSYLTEDMLNIAFSSTDILLVPYGQNGTSQSGPLSLCRNYGIPAIVRAGGEMERYVLELNVGLACADTEQFISAINKYNLSIPEETFRSLDCAKQKYSWKAAANKYLEVFK
ncbi:glycosyltransferase [Shewanella insulae]|uniref:glycosyltransferase n=1 Tax=Shewanella insulae TaxID=2681496 RepID=UPI0024818B3E|nr:glycosyltransferase [Shewanella insulae]